MARGIPKSTKEMRPVATMVDTDEILTNVKIAGRWYTARIALADFKGLLADIVEGSICDFYNCPQYNVATEATEDPVFYLYDTRAISFMVPTLEHSVGGVVFGPNDTIEANPMTKLAAISLPVLADAGKIVCVLHPELAEFHVPLLTQTVGDFIVASCSSLAALEYTLLEDVGGKFDISANLNTGARIPASVGGDIFIGGSEVVDVDISGLTSWGGDEFNAINAALSVTSVNAILEKLDSLTLTGKTISLNGGTSAAPTGAGATAKANLISDGNTVTTN